MSAAPFVLVHGAWHGAWVYGPLIHLLAAHGRAALACDLPGHGLQARLPASFLQRPLDAAAFAAEPSPAAALTLDDYADAVLRSVDAARALGHPKVIAVGHSMGGIAITAAAERAPEKFAAVVYLTAFMPAPGVPAVAYIGAPENAGELVGPLLAADPAHTGALRIDTRSADPDYRSRIRQAFCADIDAAAFDAVCQLLTPDVPAAPMLAPTAASRERWGAIPRHYVACAADWALRPALQRRFVDEADRWCPDNPTVVHPMSASHSPFLSQPAALAQTLLRV